MLRDYLWYGYYDLRKAFQSYSQGSKLQFNEISSDKQNTLELDVTKDKTLSETSTVSTATGESRDWQHDTSRGAELASRWLYWDVKVSGLSI